MYDLQISPMNEASTDYVVQRDSVPGFSCIQLSGWTEFSMDTLTSTGAAN